jgi:exo-beta-1,3-glucanase (GH17 family)
VVTVVNTVYAEATAQPDVLVFVDQNGKPVSTSTRFHEAKPYKTESSAPVKSDSSVVVAAAAPTTTSQAPAAVATSSSTTSVAATTTSKAPAASSSAATAPSGSGFGVTYNPYNADGTCKTASQVLKDITALGTGYSFVRVYGTDCDTVPNVLAACKANGLKLFAGIFKLSGLSSQANDIISAVGGDWSSIHTISVGNELVDNGGSDVATVTAAVSTVRGLVRSAGYTGPVVTVDTLAATILHPELCSASDYCAVNCHPFFDSNTDAANAGSFITTQLARLRNVLDNKSQSIIITETGWPSQGDTNGKAVPSKSNQATAISSIRTAFSSNPAGVTLFNPYNMYWKKSSSNQFEAEPYWGFLGDCPSG